MSPRRRTLCSVHIFLSLINGFVVSCPMGPSVVTEYYPALNAPPNVFPGQRFNEFSFASYPPGLSINTVATTNYGAPSPFPITEPIQEIESVTFQIPSLPPSPITVLSPPPPSPQTIIKEVTYNTPTENCQQIVETEITAVNCIPTVPPSPVPVPAPCQSLPVTLQINMAPVCSEPLSFNSQTAPCSSPYSSYEMPPPPIIVMEKSKSSLKSILPILLLTMFDGGCGNNGGGGCSCSQCTAPTLVPFPIVIPTSNPVITRGRCKSKCAVAE